MAEPSWDLNPDRLRTDPNTIRQLEQRIAQVPPSQRSNYQLRMMGIEIPPGYRLGPDGRLQYVAVDNSQHWYNKPEVMIPLILSAGMTYGATTPAGLGLNAADGGLAASMGAPAATEAGIFGSSAAQASAAAAGGAAIPAATAAGGGSTLSRIPWGNVARTAIPVGGALTARALTNGGNENAGGSGADMPPELRELLNLQLNRIKQAQPNYDLMLNMARGMTPQWARDTVPQGGGGNSQMADLISRMAERR